MIEAVAGAARLARLGRGQGRGDACRRGWPPTATSETDEHLARLARLSLADGDGGEPVGGVGRRPRRHGRDPARDDVDLEARRAPARRPREPSSRPRSSAPSASSPTRASWPRRRRRWSRPSATSSRALRSRAGGAVSAPRQREPEEAERYLLSLELFGMRFGLDRMRRLMTALGTPSCASSRSTWSGPTASPRRCG